MKNETPTTRRFPRTLSEAFPSDRANAIHCYRRKPVWKARLRTAVILWCILGLVGWLLASLMYPR